MFVVVILPVLEVYFVVLILIFSILTIKEKQIWSPEALTIPKDTQNQTNQLPFATSC